MKKTKKIVKKKFTERKIKKYKIANRYADDTIHEISSGSTYELKIRVVNSFLTLLSDDLGISNLNEIASETLVDTIKKFNEYEYKTTTIETFMTVIINFIKWLHKKKIINEKLEMPDVDIKRSMENLPRYIPTAREIFSVRRQRYERLDKAVLLEMLISTGLRSSELRQVRAEDITFGDIPYDLELDGKSEYFCGSIKAYRSRMSLKGKTSRKVYISKACGRILKLYLKINRIPARSEIPLFPYGDRVFGKWMQALTCGFVDSSNSTILATETDRAEELTDVDENKYSIDPALAAAIKSRKERNIRKSDPFKEKKKNIIYSRDILREEKTFMSPHDMRHLFACCMHYRNYYGERRTTGRLSEILGHSYSQQYLTYIENLDVIQGDGDWKKIMLGSSMDWNNLVLRYGKEIQEIY